jgi:hypothetical protein
MILLVVLCKHPTVQYQPPANQVVLVACPLCPLQEVEAAAAVAAVAVAEAKAHHKKEEAEAHHQVHYHSQPQVAKESRD